MPSEIESAGKQVLKDLWGMVLLRGILMILLGIILLAWPMSSITTMIIFMGAWWLVDGIATVFKSIKGRKEIAGWGWGIFTGILGVIAGIIVLSQPVLSTIITSTFIIWFLGIAAIIYGISAIVTGIRVRKEMKGEWSMILGGLLSIIFGIILLSSPFVSALTIIKIMGVVALIGGITIIIVAFSVRKKAKKLID